jgi:hypothetical protein
MREQGGVLLSLIIVHCARELTPAVHSSVCMMWDLITHCTKNLIYVFPEMRMCGLVPNSYIHVSVSDFYIPRISLPIRLQQNRQTNPGNIYHAHRYMNVEIGRQNIIIRPRSFISGNT